MKKQIRKIYVVYFAVIFIFLLYVLLLVNLQLVRGEQNLTLSQKRIMSSQVIKAPRGEIIDRNGRPLVTNKMVFCIYFDRAMVPSSEINGIMHAIGENFSLAGVQPAETFPIAGYPDYYFKEDVTNEQTEKFNKFLQKKKIDKELEPAQIMEALVKVYKMTDYSPDKVRDMIALRYELDSKPSSDKSAYCLFSDASIALVTKVREKYLDLGGVYVEVEPIREYVQSGLASHILGRVGPIFAEEYAKLKDKGYSLNDVTGKDGIEKTCEEFLKGVDGLKNIQKDKDGIISEVSEKRSAVPGNNVTLTIDIELQKAAEESLALRIPQIRNNAKNNVNDHQGDDAYAGSVVAIDVNTGEILALATHPTFDINNYYRDFNLMMNDPLKPMLNRAISGAYPPGSTFKMATALAALSENAISTHTAFSCTGRYTFFPSYQPTCYRGRSHGVRDVSGALQVSCNCFFFDAGRLVGIDKLNEYSSRLGLGKATGIELPAESKGILAGREHREKQGKVWNPGDTIQASIGQSDNMITPIQLATYVSTFATGGTRYQPHIVKTVKDYHFTNTIMSKDPVVADQIDITSANINTIVNGMAQMVSQSSSVGPHFRDIPGGVAGKTGTAEVPGGSNNAIFVCFAPIENPQIAISVVIEHGGEGSYVAVIAKDILEKYFSNTKIDDIIIPAGQLIA